MVVHYPDSVNRVQPPNTTIPKTLAALPSSQYATALELVSGKLEAFFVCAWNGWALSDETNVDVDLLIVQAEALFDLIVAGAFRVEGLASCDALVLQRRQSKKRRESLGAALRNARAKGDVGSIKNQRCCGREAGD
jgi:hypothetical protein